MATVSSRRRRIRRKQKEETKYLVQEREGQEDKVLIYTDALAKRSDMFRISAEEALEILREQNPDLYETFEEAPEQPAEAAGPVLDDGGEGSSVLAEVGEADAEEDEGFIEVPEPVKPKTDPSNVIPDFDPDNDPELKMVDSFTTKNQVEHFLLLKGIEIENASDMKLAQLKEDAISAVIASRMEK